MIAFVGIFSKQCVFQLRCCRLCHAYKSCKNILGGGTKLKATCSVVLPQ